MRRENPVDAGMTPPGPKKPASLASTFNGIAAIMHVDKKNLPSAASAVAEVLRAEADALRGLSAAGNADATKNPGPCPVDLDAAALKMLSAVIACLEDEHSQSSDRRRWWTPSSLVQAWRRVAHWSPGAPRPLAFTLLVGHRAEENPRATEQRSERSTGAVPRS